MKIRIGMETFIAPLAIGLIIGTVAVAQQEAQQQKKDTAGTARSQSNAEQNKSDQATTNQNRAGDPNRNALSDFSKQGMYDVYRKHWDTRFRDPSFMTYREQQMRQPANAVPPNQTNPAGIDRTRNVTTYDQFSQDPALWADRHRSGQAWQMSDSYWRLSDRYWRDPERRKMEGMDNYWKQSEAYWHDSDRYWDMYYGEPDADELNPTDSRNNPNNERSPSNPNNK